LKLRLFEKLLDEIFIIFQYRNLIYQMKILSDDRYNKNHENSDIEFDVINSNLIIIRHKQVLQTFKHMNLIIRWNLFFQDNTSFKIIVSYQQNYRKKFNVFEFL
jgi:hypothetical protein